jgi:hypothetical protein
MPTDPNTPLQLPRAHRAVANVDPRDGATRYYGACTGGDFRAGTLRTTEAAARADVQEHLDSVRRYPHRPAVHILSGPEHRFVGWCQVGDFAAQIDRSTWTEAVADVTQHLVDVYGADAPTDPSVRGSSSERFWTALLTARSLRLDS